MPEDDARVENDDDPTIGDEADVAKRLLQQPQQQQEQQQLNQQQQSQQAVQSPPRHRSASEIEQSVAADSMSALGMGRPPLSRVSIPPHDLLRAPI